jgi:hypothetical protein
MVEELRGLDRRQAELESLAAAAGAPESVPFLHPNLTELYRRKVEALEDALRDRPAAAAATEALRTLIDAILIYPGERRGDVRIELRGDLAAFLYLSEATQGADNRRVAFAQLEPAGRSNRLLPARRGRAGARSWKLRSCSTRRQRGALPPRRTRGQPRSPGLPPGRTATTATKALRPLTGSDIRPIRKHRLINSPRKLID